MALREPQNERIHREMFRLHWDIYGGALLRTKTILQMLHELEADRDIRPEVKTVIGRIELLRNALESVGEMAAAIRTDILRENGCDGSCSEGAHAESKKYRESS